MNIKIVPPAFEYKDSFLSGLEALDSQAEISSWIYLNSFADLNTLPSKFAKYVKSLIALESKPPEGFVKDTVYWAIHNGEMVGRISIRHELNALLKRVGGHIGYITHPNYRGQGVATQMLQAILKTERAKNIGRLLLTCDEGNLASEKTILKNGGKFSGLIPFGPNQPQKKHYWIEL